MTARPHGGADASSPTVICRYRLGMATDVTDLTFGVEVMERSASVPVVVDLWAPWCGPCRTLGPILEKVVDETDGEVELVKVNIDENPQIAAAFGVQSIPAVFALRDGQVVDTFIGAVPEPAVRTFIDGLARAKLSEADRLVALGDEQSIRAALELEPDHGEAIRSLAEILVADGNAADALDLLSRIPETPETRRIAALARLSMSGDETLIDSDDLEERLNSLLDVVRDDDVARQEYVDVLAAMDPEDPRTSLFRKRLSARLF
ncbi:MAG TPA: thioredoxin [Acidimicrobiales bacterium]